MEKRGSTLKSYDTFNLVFLHLIIILTVFVAKKSQNTFLLLTAMQWRNKNMCWLNEYIQFTYNTYYDHVSFEIFKTWW